LFHEKKGVLSPQSGLSYFNINNIHGEQTHQKVLWMGQCSYYSTWAPYPNRSTSNRSTLKYWFVHIHWNVGYFVKDKDQDHFEYVHKNVPHD